MSDRSHFRDEGLGTALRELEIPEHRPNFERELRRRLEQAGQPPARRRWIVPTAALAGAAALAAGIVFLVGLPGSGTGASPALAARVKALVAKTFSSGETLSGQIVYRSFGSAGPSHARVSFAMNANGDLRTEDLRTHEVSVYDDARAVERSLNRSAALSSKTLFAAERTGIAPGPPDGGPSDAFLQRQLGSYARALLLARDPRLQPVGYRGRKAWRISLPVTPNRRSPDYDRLVITVDAATGIPVDVLGTLHGKRRFSLAVAGLAVDAPLQAGSFALRFPAGAQILREDDGFRRVDVARAAARLGYQPLVPAEVPVGYRSDSAMVAQRSPEASTGVANPPSRKVFSLSYRRGFQQFIVTTRLRGSGGTWHDPLGVDGIELHPETVRLRSGGLAGTQAQVVVDPRTVPHIWALTGRLVVTVSGDLSREQLLAIANSLHPAGA